MRYRQTINSNTWSLRSIERQLNSFHSPLCQEKLFYITKMCLAKVNQILSFLAVWNLAGTRRWFSVNTASWRCVVADQRCVHDGFVRFRRLYPLSQKTALFPKFFSLSTSILIQTHVNNISLNCILSHCRAESVCRIPRIWTNHVITGFCRGCGGQIEDSIDADQLTSQKPADLDLHSFQSEICPRSAW